MQIWLKSTLLPTESTKGSRTAIPTVSHIPVTDTRRRSWSTPARMVVAAPCCQVLRSPVLAPLRSAPTRTRRTTMTMTKMMSCCLAGEGTFHSSSSRKTPIPMPAMKATVRLIIAPMSAAVSVYRSRSGDSAWVSALVWLGALRMAVKADSAPATVQVRVEVRRIHTPERRAESAFSDMARMASPHEVNRTASTRMIVTMGATISVSTSVGVMMNGPSEKDRSKGTGTGL